eukprot:TRINITY_DN114984_c0_g1_i1.p1 TRINITY_DN114984_c0_g1~~TRINITY_DN114984_c0_g1_i1.p1  ORF type:complete len:237 (-),score=52.59 TRINITY_DN114984_c0_g1_i1:104-760(-)
MVYRTWRTQIVAVGCFIGLFAGTSTADEEAPAVPISDTDRPTALIACKNALWRKWSAGMEEIEGFVNATLDASRVNEKGEKDIDGQPSLNYTAATRLLAERQLAACSREITAADLEVEKASGQLSEAAIERLLGGPALAYDLGGDEREAYDRALKGQRVDSDAPSIMGIQVHKVPLPLQLLYMVGVVGALVYVMMFAVRKLTEGKKDDAKDDKRKKRA